MLIEADNYHALQLLANLYEARKRPSPLLMGTEKVWAAAAVHAVGRINYLDDSSGTPHCKPRVINAFFGIPESIGQNNSAPFGRTSLSPLSGTRRRMVWLRASSGRVAKRLSAVR